MIRRKTLFVLGAGASKPFKYPTGIELRKQILEGKYLTLLSEILDEDRLYKGIHDKNPDDMIKYFINEFSKSSTYSIDAFLEGRKEFMQIGKMAIAYCLIQFEKDGILREVDENWYMYLLSRMGTTFDDFDQNPISFITFNYDRSLEQFFWGALKSKYNQSDQRTEEKFSKIPIVHLYGKLDDLPWQKKNNSDSSYEYDFNNFTEERIKERLRKNISNLQLITDERTIEHSEPFQKAHSLIRESERIYFLGFGFDELNFTRLKPGFKNGRQEIYYTSIGIEPSKLSWLRNEFHSMASGSAVYHPDSKVGNLKSDELLKHYLPIE